MLKVSFRRFALVAAVLLGLPLFQPGWSPEAAAKPPPAGRKTFVIDDHGGCNTVPPANTAPPATLTLYRNGTFTAVDDYSGDTGTGTWYTRRGGREIVFEIDGIDLNYVGTRANNGEYRGTMAILNGPTGTWRGAYVP